MIKTDTPMRIIPSQRKDLIYVGVYAPWRVDTQGEAILPEELEATAHDFALSDRFGNIDQEHDNVRTGCRVVESFMSVKGDTRFPVPGTWAVAIQLTPEKAEEVEQGKIQGLSLEWKKPPVKRAYPTLVASPVFADGVTEVSLNPDVPEHTHSVQVYFDENGRIKPTISGAPNQEGVPFHIHEIVLPTGTETTLQHSHRFDLEPNDADASIHIEYAERIQVVTYLFDLQVDWISLVEHGANWMPISAMKADQIRAGSN